MNNFRRMSFVRFASFIMVMATIIAVIGLIGSISSDKSYDLSQKFGKGEVIYHRHCYNFKSEEFYLETCVLKVNKLRELEDDATNVMIDPECKITGETDPIQSTMSNEFINSLNGKYSSTNSDCVITSDNYAVLRGDTLSIMRINATTGF